MYSGLHQVPKSGTNMWKLGSPDVLQGVFGTSLAITFSSMSHLQS